MIGRLGRGLGIATLAMVALTGMSAARAQTAAATAPLFVVSTGLQVGNASVAVSGTTMQATVNLQGVQANTTYTICITNPFLEAQAGPCTTPGAAASAPCIPIVTPDGVICMGGLIMSSGDAFGTLTTGATGSGSATVAIPRLLPVVIVVVTSDISPGDSARAVVNVGAAGSSPCGPGPFC